MDVTLCDVGPRDGLQAEAVAVPAATRAELCARLAAAGVPLIEAVSFVRDELVPAMAGPEAVVAALDPAVVPGLAGLVLNERGYAQTTTKSIADRAGVAAGSFYQYFPDKDAVLRELAAIRLAGLRERIDRALGPQPQSVSAVPSKADAGRLEPCARTTRRSRRPALTSSRKMSLGNTAGCDNPDERGRVSPR